ncbi:MAG TPA: hypothetical protein VF824_01660 [Thermoanaerobaculia bacterium]|jgi:hypothetical protein
MNERNGGFALLAGNAAMLVTMLLHPTGPEVVQSERAQLIATIAHTVAAFAIPLMFLGALAISRKLSEVCALVVYGFAEAAGFIALVMSGYVATRVAHAMQGAEPQLRDTWRVAFKYTGILNQAFSRVFVVAAAVAIIVWSTTMLRRRIFGRGIAIYGLVCGIVLTIVVASGLLRLNVHGFGVAMLALGIWFVIVAAELVARPDGRPFA